MRFRFNNYYSDNCERRKDTTKNGIFLSLTFRLQLVCTYNQTGKIETDIRDALPQTDVLLGWPSSSSNESLRAHTHIAYARHVNPFGNLTCLQLFVVCIESRVCHTQKIKRVAGKTIKRKKEFRIAMREEKHCGRSFATCTYILFAWCYYL